MYVQLPPPREGAPLPVPHFPAPYQCVIFRNWGMVPAERIARVIGATRAQVRKSAADMGLADVAVNPDWLDKGYITIIRANWHLLPYDGLCALLGWTEEQLSFTLREDDFLDVKLGGSKPPAADHRYRALTASEQERTAEIKRIVSAACAKLPPVAVAPFDFSANFTAYSGQRHAPDRPRYGERFVYSYCSLYGDAFSDRRLLDDSFPDSLLQAYSALGITGVWTHIVLYRITPFPFDETLSEGWRQRLDGMKYLTEKLARHGLKLFLYFNEPRALPESFFAAHPGMRGATDGAHSTLCIRRPETQAYLRNNVALLCRELPLLGGFFTITASENLTNCHSHHAKEGLTPCPRCAEEAPEATYALVNRLVMEGVRAASSSAKVIAWSWGWDPAITPDVIAKLPADVTVMNVSEQAVKKRIGGVETSVLDYSISVEGPGEYALDTWTRAHDTGHRAYAKLQLNNSWEFAVTPCIPVFEKTYRLMKRLTDAGAARPDGLMLSWSLGGCPSPTLELAAAFYDSSTPVPELDALYARMFPGCCDIPLLGDAIHLFSEAFDEYPFHIGTVYQGPQQCAPANLLYSAPTGQRASMVGFPYDDLDGWRSIFPAGIYIAQLKKMSGMWSQGLDMLRRACAGGENDPKTRALMDCAEICDCHFRSMYLQSAYICRRDGREAEALLRLEAPEIPEILSEEGAISLRVAAIQARNAAIGYESSNHYYYHRSALLEKYLSCQHLAREASGRKQWKI